MVVGGGAGAGRGVLCGLESPKWGRLVVYCGARRGSRGVVVVRACTPGPREGFAGGGGGEGTTDVNSFAQRLAPR